MTRCSWRYHRSAGPGASDDQQWWITSIYGFLDVEFLITMGALGDRIGHRRLLLIGGTVSRFSASMLAAFSTGPEMLIAARALLGIAGAAMMPSTLALIVNMFRDDKQRGVAIAVWATISSPAPSRPGHRRADQPVFLCGPQCSC